MSTPTDEQAVEPAVSLSELLTQQALGQHVLEKIKTVVDANRADTTAAFKARYQDEGITSVDVRLPTGEKVAKASLSVSNDTPVVDNELAFREWMEEQDPESIEVIVQVRPNVQKALFEKGVECRDGEVFSKRTGEPIPGLKVKPGGQVGSFSLRGIKGEDSVAALDAYVREASLAQLLAAPETEAGATVQGEVLSVDGDQ